MRRVRLMLKSVKGNFYYLNNPINNHKNKIK